MKPLITAAGGIEIHHNGQLLDTLDPLDARSYALMILEAADSALTQQARNYSFRTRARKTS